MCTKYCLVLQKKQNVLHIAAHERQLECLKELHVSLPSDESDLYFTLDKVGVEQVLR